MTHLCVHEWGRVSVYNGTGKRPPEYFTRTQANALIAAARAHGLGGDEGAGILSEHHTFLKAKQMVGVIAAPGCSLEILPKVDAVGSSSAGEDAATVRTRLIRMLDVALGLNIGDGAAASMARQNASLLDILIRLFADRLLAEARRGLPRAYLEQEDDLPALRGRLNVMRQFAALAVRSDRLACRYDALSPDTALMQIMKACVLVLRRHARAGETQRRLDELRFLMADISDLELNALPWNAIRINRSNRRWETLFGLARLFLKREWQATHHDARAGQGITLLFPMNDLFEAYIAALIKRTVRENDLTVHEQSGRLFCLIEEGEGGRRRFQTKPDILIKHKGEPAMVIDTKWKRLLAVVDDAKHGVSQSDIYQMMAYAQLYGCAETMLLYPHYDGLGDDEVRRAYGINVGLKNGRQSRLHVASINIAADEKHLSQQLRQLVALYTTA